MRRNTELIMHTPLHVYTVTLCSLSLFVLLSKALFPHSKFTCGQQRGKGLVLGIAESNFELLRGGACFKNLPFNPWTQKRCTIIVQRS